MDRVRVYAPGATMPVTTASRAPPSPAQAALTTKARTWSRATLRPDSEAATSSSRTARQLRPTRLRARLASRTSAIRADAQVTQACQRVGGNVGPSEAGAVMATD